MPDRGGDQDPVTLGEVVRNLEKLAEQMEKGFARVDDRFNGLAMVHTDVYLADRAADSERHKALTERVDGAAKVAWWALGLVATACFGAIMFGLLAAVKP